MLASGEVNDLFLELRQTVPVPPLDFEQRGAPHRLHPPLAHRQTAFTAWVGACYRLSRPHLLLGHTHAQDLQGGGLGEGEALPY